MKKILLLILIFIVFSCKKKDKPKPEQILGTRYSMLDQWVYSAIDKKDKKDRVTLIYALEEVTVIKEEELKDKKFYYLKTVTGIEGYSLSTNFCEMVLFAVKEGILAFRKPTLTAGTQGKLLPASVCMIKEIQTEWANADCLDASEKDGAVVDYRDVWIQYQDEKFSNDPLLGQTALLIRDSKKLIQAYNANPEQNAKKLEEAKELLEKAIEKTDQFEWIARSILFKIDPTNPLAQPKEDVKPVEQNPENLPPPEKEKE